MPKKTTSILEEHDVSHLRGAEAAIKILMARLPEYSRLSKAGKRVCDRACDARNALRELLEEHDGGGLDLETLKA